MKKKALLAAIAVSCTFAFTAPAFAAPVNIFSDVPAKHWSYDAIQQLSKDGIISGYGDGTFRGDRTMTRYEMAEIVANAMTKVDKADAKQKVIIDKLTQEYNADLVKIGARVASLEAAKPNVKIMGQARFTASFRNDTSDTAQRDKWNTLVPGYTIPSYQKAAVEMPAILITSGPLAGTTQPAYTIPAVNMPAVNVPAVTAPILNDQKTNYYTYRIRLEALANFGKDFSFFTRLRAQQYNVEGNNGTVGTGSFDQTRIEQFWMNWKKPFNVEKTQLTIGRQGLYLGKGGVAMAVGDIDMVMADYANKGFNAKVALRNNASTGAQDNKELYTQISGKVSPTINMSLFNMKSLQDFKILGNSRNLWSVGADVKIGGKYSAFGEYAENRDAKTENKIYWAGITNGNPFAHPDLGFQVPFTKKGANAQSLIYRYYGGHNGIYSNAVAAGDNQLHSVLGNEGTNGVLWLAGTKGVEFYTEHILEKNVALIVKLGQAKDIQTNKKVTDYALFQLYTFF